jgi:hypothetical protein
LELLALIDRGGSETVEELDGDGLFPNRVQGAVHDSESAFADEFVDAVLFGYGLADDVLGVAFHHPVRGALSRTSGFAAPPVSAVSLVICK